MEVNEPLMEVKEPLMEEEKPHASVTATCQNSHLNQPKESEDKKMGRGGEEGKWWVAKGRGQRGVTLSGTCMSYSANFIIFFTSSSFHLEILSVQYKQFTYDTY